MGISKDLKDKAQKTREDDVFTLKLDEGVSLAMLVSFARDMFRGLAPKILAFGRQTTVLVSVRGGGPVASN